MTSGEAVRVHPGAADVVELRAGGWPVVAAQECRDLWLGGRAPMLLFAYSLLLSAMTYLAATNQVLNFLERREALNLVLQVAVAVGSLLTLVVAADGVSGERERGTLESLLLTPVSRRGLLVGKLLGALSVWGACYVVLVPYLLVLGRGLSMTGTAIGLGLSVGTLLALGLATLGLLISSLCNTNRVSLAGSLFLLLALFVPSQLPMGPNPGWFFDVVLVRANPVASSLHYLSQVLVQGHTWTQDIGYLVGPAVVAAVAIGVLLTIADRLMGLQAGVEGR
ncbi:MAG TPA: ABC transporter permease subunit [Nocardioidaceae bacterium]|nr:ABC transporter permease subunit [Nocardioidaceae bacterium]